MQTTRRSFLTGCAAVIAAASMSTPAKAGKLIDNTIPAFRISCPHTGCFYHRPSKKYPEGICSFSQEENKK